MPAAPPRDDHGRIVPHDHPEIHDEDFVLRHIVRQDLHHDVETNITRVSSGAYSESSDGGMSVDILRWMAEDALFDLYYLPDETIGATKVLVGYLRGLGLRVGWDPDSGHPHHGAVWGIKQTHRRKIAKAAITVKRAEGETGPDGK